MTTLLGEVYGAVTDLVTGLDEPDWERRTRAAAWNVRELLFHQLLDAQRALVAFATPSDAEPDVDEATYWAAFRPGEDEWSTAHARFVVRAVAAYEKSQWLLEQWTITSAAAVRAAAAADPAGRVSTQGHVLAVPDFVSTLVVESTIHLLDATLELPGGPPAAALAHTRRVLERIKGGPLTEGADDAAAILCATGRLPSRDPAYPLLA